MARPGRGGAVVASVGFIIFRGFIIFAVWDAAGWGGLRGLGVPPGGKLRRGGSALPCWGQDFGGLACSCSVSTLWFC